MRDEEVKTYFIPENYIGDDRVLNGQFKTRNLIEAIIAFFIVAVPAHELVKSASLSARISVPLCAGILLAIFVYNGIDNEPFSSGILSMLKYLRTKRLYIYEKSESALSKTPFESMLDEDRESAIQKMYAKYKEGRKTEFVSYNSLVEGENYEREGSYLKSLRYETQKKKSTDIMTVYSADFSSDFTFVYGEEEY